MSGDCKFGPEEHDGSRFCHEHVGRLEAWSVLWEGCNVWTKARNVEIRLAQAAASPMGDNMGDSDPP